MTLTFLRRWPFWTVASLTLVLIAGWSLAVYNHSVSRHNATTAASLNQTNAELTSQLDDLTRDRDTLQTNQSAIESAVQLREDEAKRQATDLQQREDAVKKREAAITEQEKVQAQNTITEGNWAVGVDVQPGTYRTKDTVSGSCYWGIYADANGDDIVANDIVKGGRPTVTLKPGQFFKTSRCGDWLRI